MTQPAAAGPSTPHHHAGPLGVLITAVTAGFFAGLGESLMFCYESYVKREIVTEELSNRILYLSPLANAGVTLTVGLLLLAVGVVIKPARSWRTVLMVMIALAVFSPLLWIGSIAWWAAAIVALAVGSVTSSLISARPRTRTIALASAFALSSAFVLIAAIAVPAARSADETKALATLPPHTPGAPNILLIVLDTVRSESMSVYGSDNPTPTHPVAPNHQPRDTTPKLKAFAQQGVVFENAIAPGAWTLPTHVALLGGVYRHEMAPGVNWAGRMEPDRVALQHVLANAGYRAGGFVANISFAGHRRGISSGFHRFLDNRLSFGELLNSSGTIRRFVYPNLFRPLGYNELLYRKPGTAIIDEFLAWLDDPAAQPDRPFFSLLNFYDAHQPYYPPEPYRSTFGPTTLVQGYFTDYIDHASNKTLDNTSPDEIQHCINAYDGAILYLDHLLDTLFQQLASRGKLDNTIVVVTSDHGEAMAEHYVMGHGETLHAQLVRVPLIIRFPSAVPAGLRVAHPVSLRDVAGTVLDLAGRADLVASLGRGSEHPDTRSLRPAWTTPNDHAAITNAVSPAISQLNNAYHVLPWAHQHLDPATGPHPQDGHARTIVLPDGHHYLLAADGREWLFNIYADPSNLAPLIPTPERPDTPAIADAPAIIAEARRRLIEVVKPTRPLATPKPVISPSTAGDN